MTGVLVPTYAIAGSKFSTSNIYPVRQLLGFPEMLPTEEIYAGHMIPTYSNSPYSRFPVITTKAGNSP